jgi:hypothetical protein
LSQLRDNYDRRRTSRHIEVLAAADIRRVRHGIFSDSTQTVEGRCQPLNYVARRRRCSRQIVHRTKLPEPGTITSTRNSSKLPTYAPSHRCPVQDRRSDVSRTSSYGAQVARYLSGDLRRIVDIPYVSWSSIRSAATNRFNLTFVRFVPR